MKVSELEGPQLDYWVLRALGDESVKDRSFDVWIAAKWAQCDSCGSSRWYSVRKPSSEWLVGGPIIERENITLDRDMDGWVAEIPLMENGAWWHTIQSPSAHGHTPLIAAMRCYVASKFGEEVGDGISYADLGTLCPTYADIPDALGG